jgi:uncharacterized membrane protein YedE/YeeE
MTKMDMWSALAGGALIGLAAMLLLWFNGRIAGISGMLNGAVEESAHERSWRVIFLVGLIAGALGYAQLDPGDFAIREDFPIWALAVAGLLVGYGTRLGSGCTSGHGVCGISRFSMRSVYATATFMASGFITTTIVRHVIGGLG